MENKLDAKSIMDNKVEVMSEENSIKDNIISNMNKSNFIKNELSVIDKKEIISNEVGGINKENLKSEKLLDDYIECLFEYLKDNNISKKDDAIIPFSTNYLMTSLILSPVLFLVFNTYAFIFSLIAMVVFYVISIFSIDIFVTYKYGLNEKLKNKNEQAKKLLEIIKKNNTDKMNLENYLKDKDLISNLYPNHNITKENKIKFYLVLNEAILNDDKRLLNTIDKINGDFNITNKQIESLFGSGIQEKFDNEVVNNKIRRFEEIKVKYFNLFEKVTNKNNKYYKINNYILNNPYDNNLDKMLDDFLNDENYIEILNRYTYLVNFFDFNKEKINDEEISMFDKIQEKFNNDDRSILNDIRTLTLKIEEKD